MELYGIRKFSIKTLNTFKSLSQATGYEPSRPLVLALTRGGIGFSIFSVGLPAHPNGSSVLGEAVRCDCHSCELPTSAGGLISTDVSGAGAGEQDDNVSSYIP